MPGSSQIFITNICWLLFSPSGSSCLSRYIFVYRPAIDNHLMVSTFLPPASCLFIPVYYTVFYLRSQVFFNFPLLLLQFYQKCEKSSCLIFQNMVYSVYKITKDFYLFRLLSIFCCHNIGTDLSSVPCRLKVPPPLGGFFYCTGSRFLRRIDKSFYPCIIPFVNKFFIELL